MAPKNAKPSTIRTANTSLKLLGFERLYHGRLLIYHRKAGGLLHTTAADRTLEEHPHPSPKEYAWHQFANKRNPDARKTVYYS